MIPRLVGRSQWMGNLQGTFELVSFLSKVPNPSPETMRLSIPRCLAFSGDSVG